MRAPGRQERTPQGPGGPKRAGPVFLKPSSVAAAESARFSPGLTSPPPPPHIPPAAAAAAAAREARRPVPVLNRASRPSSPSPARLLGERSPLVNGVAASRLGQLLLCVRSRGGRRRGIAPLSPRAPAPGQNVNVSNARWRRQRSACSPIRRAPLSSQPRQRAACDRENLVYLREVVNLVVSLVTHRPPELDLSWVTARLTAPQTPGN